MPAGEKQRLDLLLAERGLADSRAKAQALVLAGQVIVDGHRLDKPGVRVSTDSEIRLKGEALPYVSRGGLKLKRAIDHFQIDAAGKICADIGASTGGFTDCLLQEGAARVYAIDVGYGQLHDKLRVDPRVVSRERVNARYLTELELPEPIDVIVIDVSFISLRQVLLPGTRPLKPNGVLIALVKPQFEVGRQKVGKGGVVRDQAARAEAIDGLVAFVKDSGFTVSGTIASPIRGPAGNLEELLVAVKNARGVR